jgi:hypothetical protein
MYVKISMAASACGGMKMAYGGWLGWRLNTTLQPLFIKYVASSQPMACQMAYEMSSMIINVNK